MIELTEEPTSRELADIERQKHDTIERMAAAKRDLEQAYLQFGEAHTDEAIDIACMRVTAAGLRVDAIRAEAVLLARGVNADG